MEVGLEVDLEVEAELLRAALVTVVVAVSARMTVIAEAAGWEAVRWPLQ